MESQKSYEEIIYVHEDNRITSEIMSQYEYTRVLALRVKQIEKGSKVYVKDDKANYEKLAKLEIKQKKCPLSIIRHLTPYIAEKWHVNEMIIPKI